MLNILHLRNREDRMDILRRELQTQGITDYNIVYGFTDQDAKRNISKGHRGIVEKAKSEGLPFVIIAEDDIKFTHPTSYQRFLETLPLDCDIYLSSIYSGDIREDNTVEWFCGMTLYAVMEQFYDTFLSVDKDDHIDRSLKGLGKYVVANPFVAIQHPGYSDQRRTVCLNDDVKLKGRKLYNGEE